MFSLNQTNPGKTVKMDVDKNPSLRVPLNTYNWAHSYTLLWSLNILVYDNFQGVTKDMFVTYLCLLERYVSDSSKNIT